MLPRHTAPTLLCLLLVNLGCGEDMGANRTSPMVPTNFSELTSGQVVPAATTTATPSTSKIPEANTKTSTEGTAPESPVFALSSAVPTPTSGETTLATNLEGTTSHDSMKPSTTSNTDESLQTIQGDTAQSGTKTQKTTPQPPQATPGSSSRPNSAQTSLSGTLPSPGSGASRDSPASPEYSSVILPVVIALIVITLAAFALVGLYRVCRRAPPGATENGSDQSQSDRESVKLLTVKTLPHDPGERPPMHSRGRN